MLSRAHNSPTSFIFGAIVHGIRPQYTIMAAESSAESEALKHSFSYLVNSIDTTALLPAALSRNLITDCQRTECSNENDSMYQRANKFLSYLQRAVNGDYHSFHTFVQILKETSQAQIASRLSGMAVTIASGEC